MVLDSEVVIAAPQETVWRFLQAPECAIYTSDSVIKAFRVPGTPTGEVGEQQCFVSQEDGYLDVSLVEVAEIERPHRVVVRHLSTPFTHLGEYRLSALSETSTRLAEKVALELPQGMGREVRREVEGELAKALRRIKACVEHPPTS